MNRHRRDVLAGIVLAAVSAMSSLPAYGKVSPHDYDKAGVSPPQAAALPRDAVVADQHGPRRLGEVVSRPAVLVFADYTCRTLCGPIVAFVGAALEHTGLRAGDQFQLVVIGLDPKDEWSDALKLRRDQLDTESALGKAAVFLTADAAQIERITSALGYRYIYDREHDQYVHPGAAFVLRPDGHVVRVLSGLGISADDMRLALVEASNGRAGTWRDDVRLLCSSFDPAHGTYNLMISRALAASVVATVVTLSGGIALLGLMGRRRSS